MQEIRSHLLFLAMFAVVSVMAAQTPALEPLSPVLLNRMRTEEKTWVLRDGARLRPSIFYFSATPSLVLRLPAERPPHETNLDDLAIVTALEFLLADDAFDEVRITLIEFNPRRLAEQTERNVVVRRPQFKAQVIGAGKSTTVGAAVKNLRGDRAALAQLRALLGLK
jgi:hypothetical protein